MKYFIALLVGVCSVLVAWGLFELLDSLLRAIARTVLLHAWRTKGRTKDWHSLLAEKEQGVIIVNYANFVFWGTKYWWVPRTNDPSRDREAEVIERWKDGEGYIVEGIGATDVQKQSVFETIKYNEIRGL